MYCGEVTFMIFFKQLHNRWFFCQFGDEPSLDIWRYFGAILELFFYLKQGNGRNNANLKSTFPKSRFIFDRSVIFKRCWFLKIVSCWFLSVWMLSTFIILIVCFCYTKKKRKISCFCYFVRCDKIRDDRHWKMFLRCLKMPAV